MDLSMLLMFDDQDNYILALLLLFLKRKLFRVELPLLLFQRDEHIRSIYSEDWICRYVDYDFYLLFRMSRETFGKLLEVVRCPELEKPYHGGGVPLTCSKSLLITLWWLGKGESLNSIADRFNVAPSTVHHYTNIVLGQLIQLMPRFIQWPNNVEAATIEEQFARLCGYPGVIGAIDGCNINFKAPVDQQDSYIDKSDNHSIKLQAVTTATRIFTNINVGFPGSVHDARIFSNSELFSNVRQNTRKYFPLEEYHILGDKAYPILGWLLTPFKDYGNLTRRQKLHNFKHSKTRIKVEHTFGILKARWRILKYINVNCPKKATRIIAACCVLHNFCYANSDEWEDVPIINDNDHEEIDGYFIRNENIGVQKREEIADSFMIA